MAKSAESPRSFTDELRRTSRQAHGISDALVNARIILVFTDRQLYARAISCFMHIFTTLEELLPGAIKSKPELHLFSDVMCETALFRAKRYQADLGFYLGPDWQSKVPPTPAVQEYVDYLRGLKDPLLLLTHAYTQYLAMVSGGQIICRMARSQMQLPQDCGTKAFEFGGANSSELKVALKARMDALGEVLSKEERQRVLAEHLNVFSLNNSVVSTFPIGWWPSARGLVLLIPPMTRYSLLVVGILSCIALFKGKKEPA